MSGKQGEWPRIGVNGGDCEGECMGSSLGDEPQTLRRCHNCGLSHLYEALEWLKSVWGINSKILFSSLS